MAELRNLIRHSTNKFSWDSGTRTFVAELSDLGRPAFSRVYDDAIDVGFILISAITGKEVTFTEYHIERDKEAEWLYSDFVPTPASIRNCPGIKGVTVRVFND